MFDKTAVVTGASGGIGKAVALTLARAGYNVAVCCHRNSKEALLLVNELVREGAYAFAFPLNVADSVQTDELMNETYARCKSLDLLVNCAGMALSALATDTTDAQYRNLLAVNTDGVFYCCRSALPYMIRQKSGSIVNISSMWGVCGASCETVYSAAKAAVIGFTKALAKEVAPSGITVNCVAPGVIDTPMNAMYTEQEMRQLAEQTPLGRIGTPQDVADAVLYLARASFVTAQVLTVDGGFIA